MKGLKNVVKLWIEKVWNRCPGRIRKEQSLLVWGMFQSHIIEARLSRTNTDIAVVPRGLTSLLQP